ncbi:hypothetical protein IWW39_000866 [Coemansia spiralis]|uniref:Periplasmic binding protein n=1 Tax=Coemansia spiralis TaxID=417178 RepID=A0A9W8L6T3_9FUNG|nr:hypothetical protein IWW39_000866 [Coemansia spiralis]
MRSNVAFPVALTALLCCGPHIVLGACNFAKTTISTSPGFNIVVSDNYKVLNDTTANIAYGLYCDSQPGNINGVTRWFKVPVDSVGTRIPVASGFLEALGQRSKLVAADFPANLTNICIDKSKVKTLGDSDTSVNVVFSNSASSDESKSVRLPSDDSLTPLQRAEWIKFVAAFFNLEEQASTLFDSISAAYTCHADNMRYLKRAPHAYWVEYMDSPTTYQIITSAYQKNLLASAGATNASTDGLADNTNVAAFQAAVKDADFVFDQTQLKKFGQRITEWYSDFGYKDPQNQGVSFLSQRNIWRTDKYTSKSGVSNYPEFAYVRPDLVLQDLISVLEPTYDRTHAQRWFFRLGGTTEDTTVISASNYDCAKPWMSVVDKCTARKDFSGGDVEEDPSSATSPGSNNGNKEDNSTDGGSSSSRAGKIAGGVIGGIAIIVLAIVATHYYNRHRRRARARALSETAFGSESIGLRNTRH